MEKIITSVIVFFSSMLKFSFSSLVAIGAQLGIEGPIVNIIGGIIGIVIFTYFGAFIQDYLVKRFPRTFNRRFTRSNRLLVRVKQRFGLNGVAALTPILLSIPVGVMFALTLTHDKKKIMMSMILSILFWATVLFLPYFVFNINILDLVRSLFEGK